VDNVIVGAAVPVEQAEPYGDALQHGGHYEFWEGLMPKNESERKLKSHAYDYYPRGRKVLFPKRQTATRLYADRCMNRDNLKDALAFFGHQEYRVEIEKDEHYRCSKCNRFFWSKATTVRYKHRGY
jgi:hypothetical protein